ncbi:MAG TPA: CpsB/CapC family capsule biosynthesis tyrosine phosphatase [Solirubrobacteraceae bacterium]|nr:CpsB/CapC family capsule biosynthesis tyrosine phosphatase [Solirubrobacteraceae bacterium]
MDGLVDIHTHLLPGIDDGPEELAGSLEMARSAVASGISRIAATPHLRSDFPGVQVREIAERVAALERELEAGGIELRVTSGAEVSLLWALEASEEELRLASFAGLGRDLLVETPDDVSMIEQLLYQVRVHGYRITLAHPERSGTFRRDPSTLSRLSEQGVLLQVNADALLAAPRNPLRKLAERLCVDGTAHVIASDGHRGRDWRPVDRLPRAVEALGELVGPERARWMAAEVPAAVLDGDPLPGAPEIRRRRGLLARWRS